MYSIYLSKNEKATPENKQPYFRVSLIDQDGNFIDAGALWKTKSGKGYSGKFDEAITVKVDASKLRPKAKKESEDDPF